MQNEIELAPRSIRRKYVSIQQYCDYLRMVLNLNEIFFRFTARKFQLPRTLPRTLSREEIMIQYQLISGWNMCIIELRNMAEAGREYSADSWKREKGELLKRTISFITGKGSVNHNSRKFHAKNTDPKRSHWNVEYCNQDIQEIYHELFDEALERYNVKQTRKDRKSL